MKKKKQPEPITLLGQRIKMMENRIERLKARLLDKYVRDPLEVKQIRKSIERLEDDVKTCKVRDVEDVLDGYEGYDT